MNNPLLPMKLVNYNNTRISGDIEVMIPNGKIRIDDVDKGIVNELKILNNYGIRTCQSCEGGVGHAFGKPTIDFFGDIKEGYKVYNIAIKHKLNVDYLVRIYNIDDNELKQVDWGIVFKKTKHKLIINKFYLKERNAAFKILRNNVKMLRNNNVKIFMFGGDNIESTCFEYSIKFKGNDTEGFRVISLCIKNKIEIHRLKRYYRPINGNLKPCEWEISFF